MSTGGTSPQLDEDALARAVFIEAAYLLAEVDAAITAEAGRSEAPAACAFLALGNSTAAPTDVAAGPQDRPPQSPDSAVSQAVFLREAMRALGMTRRALANRLGVSEKSVDNWMLTPGTAGYRRMPLVVWKFVAEVVRQRRP